MPNNIQLLIHNIGYIFGSILIICLAVLIYKKDHKQVANKLMIAGFICVALFSISHLIAVNINNSVLSREILTFNLSTIFIGVFLTHAALYLIDKTKQRRIIIFILYAVSITLATFFLIFPYTFLLTSVPKMYFPNYYQGGSLYWLMIVWNVVVSIYLIVELALAYHTTDLVLKNRIKYLAFGYVFGYGFGSIAYLLVINIPVDPIWSSFFIPMFSIPFTYAVLKYELMDIKIIAKQAFIYAVGISIVGGIIILLDYSNRLTEAVYPFLPFWITPIASAIIIILVVVLIWRRLRENEALKYEFITIIAHKFRTPLTESKWAIEELLHEEHAPKKLDNLKHIQQSNEKLVNLTGALVDLANTNKGIYSSYRPEKVSLNDLVRKAVAGFDVRFKKKGILFSAEYPASDILTSVDRERMMFVVQTLLENSQTYTPRGGKVMVSVTQSGRKAMIKVTDTGIGIEKEELPRIFSSFYRTKKAQSADTEGFGMGLSLARSIVNRHGGKVEVLSEGENKGSTFTIILPIV